MTDDVIRVVVVDDHPLFRLGLVGLLSSLDGIRVTGQAADRAGLTSAIAEPPHVILMDLHLDTPSGESESGIELTRWLHHTHPEIAVLVITMSDDDTSVAAAMRAGARGYLLKDSTPDEVVAAIRAVAAGGAVFGQSIAARIVDYFATVPAVSRSETAVEASGLSSLTEREREILTFLADGESNPTIAARLHLSPKTVRNHVSVIFSKLETTSRAQAVALARDAGLGRRHGE